MNMIDINHYVKKTFLLNLLKFTHIWAKEKCIDAQIYVHNKKGKTNLSPLFCYVFN